MALDLETRVARLEAAEQIRHLKAHYASICDSGYTPDLMVPIFTKDAVWDGGERFGSYTGIDEIYGFFEGISSEIVWALHYMIAPIVEVADDLRTATGSWYLFMAATFRAGDSEEAVWLMGRYADEYRFEDGRWKFSRVALDAQTLTPYEHGWAEVPFREG